MPDNLNIKYQIRLWQIISDKEDDQEDRDFEEEWKKIEKEEHKR
jgi:hypothetical protein